jgi:hypothetical protein
MFFNCTFWLKKGDYDSFQHSTRSVKLELRSPSCLQFEEE